jgi:hypothetical protein
MMKKSTESIAAPATCPDGAATQDGGSKADAAPLQHSVPSHFTTYTIPKGTILFHGSMNIDTFDPFDIQLADVDLAYFSQNRKFAADHIMSCSNYPLQRGYLHAFRVKEDIPKVVIMSIFKRREEWTMNWLYDHFCSGKSHPRYRGVGFFFPRGGKKSATEDAGNPAFDSEFILCNPSEYLEYINTSRCIAMRRLSKPESMTQQ